MFVYSNLRAVALAEHNARLNDISTFQALASADMSELPASSFDVVLANPPYYAQNAIDQFFIKKARVLLRPGGRVYLVTKLADYIGRIMEEKFGQTEVMKRHHYALLCTRSTIKRDRTDMINGPCSAASAYKESSGNQLPPSAPRPSAHRRMCGRCCFGLVGLCHKFCAAHKPASANRGLVPGPAPSSQA